MFASPLISELLPDQVRDAFEALHETESRQYLEALGYVPEDVTGFRADLHAFAEANPEALRRLGEQSFWGLQFPTEEEGLHEEEVALLKELCALEGAFVVEDGVPERWSRLTRRVLAFRLELLGLWTGSASCPDVAALTPALETLARLGGGTSLREAALLAGDLDRLCAVVKDQSDGLLYLRLRGQGQARPLRKTENGQAFVRQLERAVSPEVYTAFAENVLARQGVKAEKSALQAYLDAQINLPLPGLLQRLLQLRLWSQGFCESPPGDDWNADYQEALRACLRLLAGEDQAAKNLVMAQVASDVWIFNLVDLWEICGEVNAETGDAGSLVTALYELYEAPVGEEMSGKETDRLRATLHAKLEGLAQAGPRPSGRRRSGPSGARGICRILQWLRRKTANLKAAVQRFLDQVQGGAQGLLTLLRKGLYRLARTLDLVIRKPDLKTRQGGVEIRTRLTPGFDLLHVCPAGGEEQLVKRHQERLFEFFARLSAALELLAEFLRWGLQAGQGPVGWVRIGVRAARLFSNPKSK